MSIRALARTTATLPIVAMLILAGCGGGDDGLPSGMQMPLEPPDREIDLSQILTPVIDAGAAPGVVAAIIDEDGVRAIGAAGVRRQGSPEEITTDDLVHIASVTKAMTSTMLATLVEDGTFANGWNTTVAEVFPELAGSIHQDYHGVTVAQLVRMRGGLPRNPAGPAGWSAYSDNPDIKERRYNILRDNLANVPAGAVGDRLYSNLSYVLAGAMAERLTGKSWETLMQERLFAPLGMTTAAYGPSATPGGVDQPSGHNPDGSGGWMPVAFDEPATGAPAGSNLHMSIQDWAQFISLWFTGKEPAILDRATLNELRRATGPYAAGWNVVQRHWAGGTELSHGGRGSSWRAWVWIAPDRGLAYVAFANAGDREDSLAGVLRSIIASFVTNEDLPGGRGPDTPLDHVVQLARDDGISVAALRNEDGDLSGLMVGNTPVSVDFHRLGSVSGGTGRSTVGPILQNDDIRIRHIDRHWNMVTDVVSRFEHLSYGAWATVAAETGGNAGWNYRYENIGGGYLTALDDAMTPDADMPVSGTASYLGQFTGFVQFAGIDGRMLRTTGDVEMTADFASAEMTVDMLSPGGRNYVLGATIQGNGFSGTTIHDMPDGTSIQAQGATVELTGRFYGQGAVEAGGVFEIVGGRAQYPGRFVGAFGGRKDE